MGLALASHLSGAEQLPVETFFRNLHYSQAELSPDGKYLGVLVPAKKHLGLAIIDLKNRAATWACVDRGADVRWFTWATTNRLIFKLGEDGGNWPGLIAVNRDGTGPKELVHLRDRRTRFLALLPGSKDEILVNTVAYSATDAQTGLRFPHVDRLNLFSGSLAREVTNPGRVFWWQTDHCGVVRVGVAVEHTRLKVIHRPDANSAWQTLADFNYDEDGIFPAGFDYDNRTLFVKAYDHCDTLGIYTYDTAKNAIKDLAFRHAEADVGSLVFSPGKHAVVGIGFQTDLPQVYWFDADYKKMQASVDRALPNTQNFFVSSSRDGNKRLLLARGDRTPGTFYLLDATTSKIEKLFDLAEWIHSDEMAEMKAIQYTARDGLIIHGYLTLPKGSSGKHLPLIVNPHGGPVSRNVWGFDPEVQFLANRGYAVLRMNFRGSTGYGKTFLEAGYKQWGLKQQDDITDGVKWAIAQGIADPARICIFGASYGGFAALTGLEKTPELYRCGISYAGVTDLVRTLEDTPDMEFVRALIAERIGDPKKERERLKEASPLTHAEQIQVPVFLAYGGLDPKVPMSSGNDMAKALRKRGKLYGSMVKDDEGHGFFKEENRIEFWKKVDEFLKANMQ